MFSEHYSPLWGYPLIPFRIFMDHGTIYSSSPMPHLSWSSLQQKSAYNSCELLLIDVIENFILNVMGLLRSNSEIHK